MAFSSLNDTKSLLGGTNTSLTPCFVSSSLTGVVSPLPLFDHLLLHPCCTKSRQASADTPPVSASRHTSGPSSRRNSSSHSSCVTSFALTPTKLIEQLSAAGCSISACTTASAATPTLMSSLIWSPAATCTPPREASVPTLPTRSMEKAKPSFLLSSITPSSTSLFLSSEPVSAFCSENGKRFDLSTPREETITTRRSFWHLLIRRSTVYLSSASPSPTNTRVSLFSITIPLVSSSLSQLDISRPPYPLTLASTSSLRGVFSPTTATSDGPRKRSISSKSSSSSSVDLPAFFRKSSASESTLPTIASAALFPRASHSSSLCCSSPSVSSLSVSISLLARFSRSFDASLKILSISMRVCFSCSNFLARSSMSS
mmetsp:Transcript_15608/g.35989  ORF Transcript_15608/g.35989 Transcript_15608/m.35989 type:complete len:372 (-) Transcript_15608:249-1364(-)